MIDHYYRGLLYEALENPGRAYEEYQWVSYWNATYDYPFVDNDFDDRFVEVAQAVEAARAELVVTVEPPSSRPPRDQDEEAGDEETATEEPETEEAAPAATETSEPESEPEATRIPPDDIP